MGLTFYIWIPLVLVRYAFGALGALFSLPFCYYAYKNEAVEIVNKNSKNPPSTNPTPESQILEKNLAKFDKNYSKLKKDFAAIQFTSQFTSQLQDNSDKTVKPNPAKLTWSSKMIHPS